MSLSWFSGDEYPRVGVVDQMCWSDAVTRSHFPPEEARLYKHACSVPGDWEKFSGMCEKHWIEVFHG